jgi:hypothetical protein
MSAIDRVTTSNTFYQWMSSTDAVIGTVNLLTDGNGSTFVSNSNIDVNGYLNVSSDLRVTGNVIVSGNISLDEIGFDDISIAGSANIANTLYVTGISTLANANVAILSGAANNKLYSSISAIQDAAVAYAIALG